MIIDYWTPKPLHWVVNNVKCDEQKSLFPLQTLPVLSWALIVMKLKMERICGAKHLWH